MKKFSLILGLAALTAATGCVSRSPEASNPSAAREALAYAPATSSALAFDPPAVIGVPLASFSRDGRGPEAFAGYEEQITTVSYTHQRDEIHVYNETGTLERRAYTDRTSITTR